MFSLRSTAQPPLLLVWLWVQYFKMKISKARIKQIIREELFYREFHRKTGKLTEVESEKQRRYMCAMKDKNADERPEGLSKAEAEEMCSGPMKEDILDDLEGERMRRAHMKTVPPEDRKTAGTTNPWEHGAEPEEEKTFEMTPGEFEKFMRKTK